jgi:hypothetical protein
VEGRADHPTKKKLFANRKKKGFLCKDDSVLNDARISREG